MYQLSDILCKSYLEKIQSRYHFKNSFLQILSDNFLKNIFHNPDNIALLIQQPITYLFRKIFNVNRKKKKPSNYSRYFQAEFNTIFQNNHLKSSKFFLLPFHLRKEYRSHTCSFFSLYIKKNVFPNAQKRRHTYPFFAKQKVKISA